jgi:PAS domain S-box-containing protein
VTTLLDLVKNIPESLLETIPIGIVLFDSNGEIHFVNRAFRGFEILYPEVFSENLLGRNVFSENLQINKSIAIELNELREGYPFESEIKDISAGKSNLRLIIKGSPIYDESEFNGGVLLIEDLKVTQKVQRDLILQSDFLEYALSSVCNLFVVIDPNQFIKHVSGDVSSFFKSSESLFGVSLTKYLDDEISVKLKDRVDGVIQTKKNIVEIIDLSIQNTQKTFQLSLFPQLDNKQSVLFIYLLLREVPSTDFDSKSINEKFKRAEVFEHLSIAAGQAIFILDDDNKLLHWDNNCELIFEYPANQVIGNFIGELIPELNNFFISEIKSELQSTPSVRKIISFTRNTKKIVECLFTINYYDKPRLSALCNDISEATRAVEELNRTINHLAQLLSNADFLIGKIDESGTILYANKNFCDTFNYSIDQLKQKRLYDLVDQQYFEKNVFDIRSAEMNEPIKADLPFRTQKGKLLNLSITIVPEQQNGNGNNYHCYLRDIEDQRLKEKEVKLYLSMLNASNDGIALGLDGKINFANKAFAEIFNFESGEELTGKDILDLVSNDDILKVAEYFRLLERKQGAPSRFDFLGKKKDATFFHAEISAGTFAIENKSYIVLIVRDVSERIRAQRAIRESEEKYRNITENIDDFLFTFERMNQNLRPVFCTTSVQKITGYTSNRFFS